MRRSQSSLNDADEDAGMTTGQEILAATGINKWYGGVRALHDVGIEAYPREVLGLVGPNGAGKTTLVDMITGTQAADSGIIKLNGKTLRGSVARRARLGLGRTFQHPIVPSELSVVEAIVSGITASRMRNATRIVSNMFSGMFLNPAEDYKSAGRLADEFGISAIDRQCSDVTLGELRLIEVVRAVAQNPSLMLLDEPFAGADPAGVEAITLGIQRVQERGHAIILVDHNVDLVASLVDRVMLLDRGSVAFNGDPTECLKSEQMQRVYFGGIDV